MILVVDSNIVFAGLLRDSTTRRLLVDSPNSLYAPETLLIEIGKYADEIIRRSGLSKEEFEVLFSLITENIEVMEIEAYRHHLKDAEESLGRIDKGDIPFLALALSIPCDGVWTENSTHFNKQDKVKVWTTGEIIANLTNY